MCSCNQFGMAPKMKPKDLKKHVYEAGGYLDPDGQPSSFQGSGIREANVPKGASDDQPYEPGDEDKHFMVKFNPLSFSIVPKTHDAITRLLRFGPFGSTENIIYLPYHFDCITSVVIPTEDESVCYFITDALSGCNIFIDQQQNNGDLVCFHANAKRYSPPADEVRADPAAFSQLGEETMDRMHRNALLQPEFRDATPLKKLLVSEYYAKPKAEVERERKRRTGVEFFGGVTVIGFRVKKKWEFWFQTYGRITCDKVGIAAAPYKIFEARPF